ncbi:MAG TPA: TlpA disulfide reductase family protein [Vicinamibacterales bacterium]|jgi:thiol-disulfide isomerase/thioredoxin
MHTGRLLTAALAIGGAALIWTGVHYARPSGSPEAQVENAETAGTAGASEKATIRLFRDPAVVPAFAAADLDGRRVDSNAFRGKVVIVNFWATWCPPCRAEIPDLVALQEKYRDTLQVIGISQDEVPAEQVRRFAADHGMNYPIVMSTADLEKIFPGIHALPTSFILDREGRLVQKHVGMLNPTLTELEARSLAGLPVNASVERVDQSQGLSLANGAQAIDIPGVDLSKLSAAQRTEALTKLNGQSCTCGCDLTVARCRVDDPTCGVSLPLARQIVAKLVAAR